MEALAHTMPDLIAQGPRPQDRWRRPLQTTSAESVLGRTTEQWTVPWDDRISRRHATLRWNGRSLEVRRIADARNFIFYRGQQRDEFQVQIGEHFVIGQTTFTIVDQPVQISHLAAPAYSEQTYSSHLLRQSRYRDADRRIEVLGACRRSLPAAVAMKSCARASSTFCYWASRKLRS